MNNKAYLKKFDAKAQKGIFLGYSERSKAYRVYNSKTKMVKEFIHVKFNDKELEYRMSEPVERFADIQVFEDHLEARPLEIKSLGYGGSDAGLPEDDPTSVAHPKAEDYEESPNGSEVSTQPKKPFKYKVSHL